MKSSVTKIFNLKYYKRPKDGEPGSMLVIEGSPVSVPCSASGALSVSPQSLTARCYVVKGNEVDGGWTFAIHNSSAGCSLTLSDDASRSFTKIITLQSVSVDSASVIIRASKGSAVLFGQIQVIKVRQGKDGTGVGARGPYIPPPMPWSKYDDNYTFESGSSGEDRIDIVLADQPNADGSYNAYACKKTHVKKSVFSSSNGNGAYYSPAGDSVNWDYSNHYTFIATDLLLANKSYIGNLSVGSTRLYDSDGRIVGLLVSPSEADEIPSIGVQLPFFMGGVYDPETRSFSGGQPLSAIDINGRHYFGGLTGRHIEIDPVSKSMYFFDDSGNMVSRFTGDEISKDDISNLVAYSYRSANIINLLGPAVSFTDYHNGSPYTALNVSPKVSGSLVLKIPKLRLYAKRADDSFASNADSSAAIKITFNLYRVNKSVETLMVTRSVENRCNAATGVLQRYVTTDAIEEHVPCSSSLSYRLETIVQVSFNKGTAATHSASVEIADTGAEFSLEASPQSISNHYGRNGFCVSSDGSNYAFFYFDSSKVLHAKCVANGKTVFDSGNN